jgi:hypothetical protein
MGLCDGFVGVREMKHAESADDRVEARRIEREAFGIAFAKFDPRVAASRLGDHVRREIDADRVRAARGGAVGNVAWPGGHIEDAHASANASGIEKRRDGAEGDLPGKRMIIVGLGVPALPLKFLEARCVRWSALRHWRRLHLDRCGSAPAGGGERPRDHRAAAQRYERAPVHSIASSAAACSVSGTVRPSAFGGLKVD